jgi:hypothetical protein
MAKYNMTGLGMPVTQGNHAVLLSQCTYVSRLLKVFGMKDCKAAKTLTGMNVKKDSI